MIQDQRKQYLVKNTTIFAIGNIATKFLTFFLVPLYTNILSTAEYGIVDLISTISIVLSPILILNISESVMRFSLDKNANHTKIVSIGIMLYVFGLFIGLVIFPVSSLFSVTCNYSGYVYFYTITCAGSQLLLCYLRGLEKLTQYTIGGIIQIISTAFLNILFLFVFRWGIKGYLTAYILSALLTMVYASIVGNIYRIVRGFFIDFELLKQMIKYSLVLIPNTFMWWIMNTSDHIMVTAFVGSAANGIYAISYKLPTLVSTSTTIFNQAWSYSAIREEGSLDEEKYSNQVFRMLISFVMLAGIGILTFAKPFLKIYVASDYYIAWRYVPFLTIGCVYLAFGTFISTSYSVHKDSFGYLFSGCFGAAFNIVLNFLLIPKIGVFGAAIATCISYIAVFVFRLVHTQKYLHYSIKNKEFMAGSIVIIISAFLMFLDNRVGWIIQLGVCVFSVYVYFNSIYPVLKSILKKFCK